MASDSFLSWANRSVLRPCRDETYLCIQDVVVFVRDLEVSKRLYVDQLGTSATAAAPRLGGLGLFGAVT